MKGLKAILSGGMMSTKTRMGRETAKAANAEVRMKAGDNAQHQITVGGSAMHWRRDLLLGGNVSVQTPLTEETVVRAPPPPRPLACPPSPPPALVAVPA